MARLGNYRGRDRPVMSHPKRSAGPAGHAPDRAVRARRIGSRRSRYVTPASCGWRSAWRARPRPAELPGSAAGGWAAWQAGRWPRREAITLPVRALPALPLRPSGPAWLPQTAPAVSDLNLAARLALLGCEPARHLVIEPPQHRAAASVTDPPAVARLWCTADHVRVHVTRAAFVRRARRAVACRAPQHAAPRAAPAGLLAARRMTMCSGLPPESRDQDCTRRRPVPARPPRPDRSRARCRGQ